MRWALFGALALGACSNGSGAASAPVDASSDGPALPSDASAVDVDAGAGADAALPPVEMAVGQDRPFDIAVDDTNVYWVNVSSDGVHGTVMKAPIAGGAPVALAMDTRGPVALALDADTVYVLHAQFTIDRVPKAGGALVTVAGINGGYQFQYLAIDATNLYWTELQTHVVMTCPRSAARCRPSPRWMARRPRSRWTTPACTSRR